MALSILDGNQSATTLSSVVTGGEHIVAHSVVSLGSNAISNITTAISGSTVCVGNLGLLQSTVATDGSIASVNFIKIGGHTGTSTTGNIVHVSSIGAMKVDGSSFTQPVSISSVTIGNTVTIAGTVTANPTGTQTIAGTVTIGAGTAQIGSVTASGTVTANIGGIANSVTLPVRLFAEKFGEAPSGQDTLLVCNSSGMLLVDANSGGSSVLGYDGNAFVQVKQVSGSSVTVGGFSSVSIGSGALLAGGLRSGGVEPLSLDVATGYLQVKVESSLPAGTNRIGVVTIGAGTVTIGAGTAQIGSVTASISGTVPVSGTFFQATQPVSLTTLPALVAGTAQIGSVTASISGTVPISISSVTIGNSVTIGSLPAISGTVTANSSNGSLTTQFGSVVTANTAFATSAVTNANRKYLLIQNITTAANVITVGIGFTPTTTQGIQLFAGAGLTFEGSYIPTGAVNLLSSVTASCYTILEA